MIRKFSDLTHVTALANTINCNISNLFTHCVCMGVYVCVVCVRACVRIFFQRKGFSRLNKAIKCNSRDQVSAGLL